LIPLKRLLQRGPVIGGVLTIVSVTIARQCSATIRDALEIIKFLVRRTIRELDGLRPRRFWRMRYH
jgi:hypothetical protein